MADKELQWIDLGYANGWEEGSKEERIVHLIYQLGYKICHSRRGYDDERICEQAKVRWHVDSSD